ncbi:phosphotransferase family protein [Streptomyces canus]|uniref:phosphotransferase family protein n=1 Tax=Streptomyces canus TaxID=58343 RepID=UPI003711E97B
MSSQQEKLAQLRQATPPAQALRWVCDVLGPGCEVDSVRYLPGGQTNAIHAVTVTDPAGRRSTAVLRRWVLPGWDADNPDFTAGREATVLRLIEASGISAPRLLADDRGADHCDAPALLMTLLPGRPFRHGPQGLSGFLRQLAAALRTLHAVPGGAGLPPYRPYNDLKDPRVPASATCPDVWEAAFAAVAKPPPPFTPCLIHRDYHPGNTLWQDGSLTGIVDWGYASYGPPSVDLAHMRWNLVVEYGQEAAEEFADSYAGTGPARFAHHPYWDLRTVVDLAPEPAGFFARPEMERLERYLASLLPLL